MAKKTVLLSLAACLAIASSLWSASMGKQDFTFIAKPTAYPQTSSMYWIGEDIGGQYHQSQLHQVLIIDSSALCVSSDLKRFGQWQKVTDAADQLHHTKPAKVDPDDKGRIKIGEPDYIITPPASNPSLMEKFQEHIMA